MASKVAKLLRGKYKPSFTPHVDCGDNVIIINADKVKLTGKKWTDRVYLSYTGYPGGQRDITPARLMQKSPEKLIKKVVKGMLPKNILAASLLNNLYVYAGSEHPHEAQQPKTIDLNLIKSMRQAPETNNYGRTAINSGSVLGGTRGGFDAKQ